jgi:hypothetical protein
MIFIQPEYGKSHPLSIVLCPKVVLVKKSCPGWELPIPLIQKATIVA